jgi:hypothetical protein
VQNPSAECTNDSECPGGACTAPSVCQTDGDCPGSHQCIHPRPCDDVQVVAPGTTDLTPNTVVISPGIYRAANPDLPIFDARDVTIQSKFALGVCTDEPDRRCDVDLFCQTQGAGVCAKFTEAGMAFPSVLVPSFAGPSALSPAIGDDVQIVPFLQPVTELKGTNQDPRQPRCVDGSALFDRGVVGLAERFIICGIVKPGPNGRIDSDAELEGEAPLPALLSSSLAASPHLLVPEYRDRRSKSPMRST